MAEFLDVDGTPIGIGDKVHYVPEPRDWGEEEAQSPWTENRSGIVLDMGENELGHQSLFMHEYGDRHRQEGRWARDEFICGPDRLKVIAKADYPVACVLTHTPPMDFAQCETHDTTFALGQTCKFNGREMWEVYAEEADQQRQRAVRTELCLQRLHADLVDLMNSQSDSSIGRILDRENGRGGLQRAIVALGQAMKDLGLKEVY